MNAPATTPAELRAEILRLHAEASTPAEISKLLQLRGRARLGLLLGTYGSMRGGVAASLCETHARATLSGACGSGWFEPDEDWRAEKPRAQVAAAFRWAATVFRRWAAIQPPEAPALEPAKRAPVQRQKRATWIRRGY
jgi:hypothetical protein